MPETTLKLFIVEDDCLLRTSLSLIFATDGYDVRLAEDGFSALREISRDMPDLTLSDLHMPGISGFELLSMVSHRFPTVPSVAMTGSFSVDDIPEGIAADGFYQKGTDMESLLKIVRELSSPKTPTSAITPRAAGPIWIARNGHHSSGEAYVTITCAECLRAFPQALDKNTFEFHQTSCVFCSTSISYSIAELAA